jgi:hypothetical protein
MLGFVFLPQDFKNMLFFIEPFYGCADQNVYSCSKLEGPLATCRSSSETRICPPADSSMILAAITTAEPVGNQQKWDTFVKERLEGNDGVLGLPQQAVVAFAAS